MPYGGWRIVLTEKLTDIADAIREKNGIIPQNTQEFVNVEVGQINVSKSFTSSFVKLILQKPTFINCSDTDELRVAYGTSGENRLATYIVGNIDNYNWPQTIIAPYDAVGYYFVINSKSNGKYNCFVIAEPCEEDGSAIVKYTPEQMAEEIRDLTPGPSEEELCFQDAMIYRFYNGNWEWVIRKYENKITTKNLTNVTKCFYNSTLDIIPFALNGAGFLSSSFQGIFEDSRFLKKVPDIRNFENITDLDNAFYSCVSLKEFGELENIGVNKMSSIYSCFYSCYSLRKIPQVFLKLLTLTPGSYISQYNCSRVFQLCLSLDEIIGLGLPAFTNFSTSTNLYFLVFASCNRLKDLIFDLQEDGSPHVCKYTNQIIDLTQGVGYTTSGNLDATLDYNSGITADKEVVDDETYQALKNNPDWFTQKIEYSRYNHDSAVRTINSLPDTSEYLTTAGGTNTIKFKGESGSKTDGGAINTLTEEEIAVATAKGWTISFN